MLFRYSFSTQLCSTACAMSLEQNVQKCVRNNRKAMITTSLLDASTIDLLLHKKQKREAKATIDTLRNDIEISATVHHNRHSLILEKENISKHL